MLIGFGYDIHRLERGRSMRLGGVDIPAPPAGPVAHSDGDVLLHALCDALLGAAGLPDIGHQFPDTDERWRGVRSIELLDAVVTLLRERSLAPGNVDCTIVIEQPRIAPHRSSMQRVIASSLGIPVERVSIKATTNEKLGFIGAGDGVAAYAVASVTDAR